MSSQLGGVLPVDFDTTFLISLAVQGMSFCGGGIGLACRSGGGSRVLHVCGRTSQLALRKPCKLNLPRTSHAFPSGTTILDTRTYFAQGADCTLDTAVTTQSFKRSNARLPGPERPC